MLEQKSVPIGLHVGDYFAEISALRGNDWISTRWYLPKLSIKEGLKKFLSQDESFKNQKINITSTLPELAIRKQMGTPIALLVTNGFEDWPFVRQPVLENDIQYQYQRVPSPISKDYLFGLTERINAQGEEIEKIEQTELDFLVSKLELTQTKQVAIGFLHSKKNSGHETTVANYLSKKGLEVICSHQIDEPANEVARWWRAVLNAYVAPNFHEFETTIQEVENDFQVETHFLDSEGNLFSKDPKRFFSSSFGFIHSLSTQAQESEDIIFFGLEGFYHIKPHLRSTVWQSDFGPVAIVSPYFNKLKTQPTQIFTTGIWGLATKTSKEVSFEPGPMLMGRSLNPTLLDIIWVSQKLPIIEGLNELITPSTASRIEETLRTISKEKNKNDNIKLIPYFYGMIQQLIFEEVLLETNSSKIVLAGPLAEVFYPFLKQNLKNKEVLLNPEAQYVLSRTVASFRGHQK
jgi:hypothetical protein